MLLQRFGVHILNGSSYVMEKESNTQFYNLMTKRSCDILS